MIDQASWLPLRASSKVVPGTPGHDLLTAPVPGAAKSKAVAGSAKRKRAHAKPAKPGNPP